VIVIDGYEFPPFDLERLLRTVFRFEPRESFGVFTDLPDPRAVEGFSYLGHPGLGPQKLAFTVLFSGLLRPISTTRPSTPTARRAAATSTSRTRP